MPNATFSSVFKQCAFMAFILIHSFVMSPTINKDLNKVKNQTFPRCLKITKNASFEFHNFGIFFHSFVQSNMVCLVTLFEFFENSP